MVAISIVNAKKKYGDLWALKGINLDVRKGEFFGLLGPNGAGKTTLISTIVGLAHLTEGQISVHGHDVRHDFLKSRALIGFAPQDVNLDRFFPIRKILEYQAGFFGAPRKKRKHLAEEYLAQFNLEEKADVPYYKLSSGMQKRLLIAKAMISRPQVVILDEPTAGVDVEQRHQLWEYLRNLNKGGTTIILTTHYIDEAETLCERIGIINLGEIREAGSPQELIDKYCEKTVTVTMSKELDPDRFSACEFSVEVKGKTLIGRGSNVGPMIDVFNRIIAKDPECRILDLHMERGNLEEVFLKVTGKTMKDSEHAA